MRRTTRTAAGALALAVALGAASPTTALAAGHDRAGHVKVDRAEKSKADKSKADKSKQAKELRQLQRDIAKTDARLVKVARESRTAPIGEHAATVLANVAADRAALVELAGAVEAADSAVDLRAARKELRNVRAQNYNKVVNDLRHALELAGEISAASALLSADPAAPVAELAAAQLALDSAIAKALLVTASSDKDELRAVKADLEAAHAAFEIVAAYLEPVEEPVDEEPLEEEPVEEEPVENEPIEEEPVEGEPVV